MVNWYWPENWAAPSQKNPHSTKYVDPHLNQLIVGLVAPIRRESVSSIPEETSLDVYTIRYDKNFDVWVFSGPKEAEKSESKLWLTWYAAKRLRAKWEKDAYQCRLDTYKKNGDFQRSAYYGVV